MHKNLIQLSINKWMDRKNTRQNAYAILWAPLILHSYSILAASWLSSLWVLDSNIVCRSDWSREENKSVLPKDSSCRTYSSRIVNTVFMCPQDSHLILCFRLLGLMLCVLHPAFSLIELEISDVLYFQWALLRGPTNIRDTQYVHKSELWSQLGGREICAWQHATYNH